MATDRTAPTKSPRPAPEAEGRFLDAFEAELGGREPLVQALLAGPPSTDLDYVVGLIATPSNDLRKLSSICASGHVRLGEFLHAFRAGVLAPAIAKAIVIVAAKVPEITQDVVTRSVVHEDDCASCHATGLQWTAVKDTAPVSSPCGICNGSGRVTVPPDFDRQKFVLEKLAGMGPKPAPALVIDQSDHRSITMDVSAAAHGKLLGAVDKLLYGRRDLAKVIDADPIPSDTPPSDAVE